VVLISRRSSAVVNYEYGSDLRRLYPWQGVADPLWGSAIASVRPREATTMHCHDEEETFIILEGEGTIVVDGVSEAIGPGDVIYLPRGSMHSVVNGSSTAKLDFLTIFWGSPEANERMLALAAVMQRIPASAASEDIS